MTAKDLCTHIYANTGFSMIADWQWDQGASPGAEEEKVTAADGWTEVQETSVASSWLCYSLWCHWNKRQSCLWNLKVETVAIALFVSVYVWTDANQNNYITIHCHSLLIISLFAYCWRLQVVPFPPLPPCPLRPRTKKEPSVIRLV